MSSNLGAQFPSIDQTSRHPTSVGHSDASPVAHPEMSWEDDEDYYHDESGNDLRGRGRPSLGLRMGANANGMHGPTVTNEAGMY